VIQANQPAAPLSLLSTLTPYCTLATRGFSLRKCMNLIDNMISKFYIGTFAGPNLPLLHDERHRAYDGREER
jgi:hypothetical protein